MREQPHRCPSGTNFSYNQYSDLYYENKDFDKALTKFIPQIQTEFEDEDTNAWRQQDTKITLLDKKYFQRKSDRILHFYIIQKSKIVEHMLNIEVNHKFRYYLFYRHDWWHAGISKDYQKIHMSVLNGILDYERHVRDVQTAIAFITSSVYKPYFIRPTKFLSEAEKNKMINGGYASCFREHYLTTDPFVKLQGYYEYL